MKCLRDILAIPGGIRSRIRILYAVLTKCFRLPSDYKRYDEDGLEKCPMPAPLQQIEGEEQTKRRNTTKMD